MQACTVLESQFEDYDYDDEIYLLTVDKIVENVKIKLNKYGNFFKL